MAMEVLKPTFPVESTLFIVLSPEKLTGRYSFNESWTLDPVPPFEMGRIPLVSVQDSRRKAPSFTI